VEAEPQDGEGRNRENVRHEGRLSIYCYCSELLCELQEREQEIESQTNARTNIGFYTRHHINTDKLISVVKPALLRAILPQHLPDNVPISATQLHNFRVRAKLLAQSGKLDAINESDSKMMFEGLDNDTPISSDAAERCAIELPREELQESEDV
jgi:hypothetical protein